MFLDSTKLWGIARGIVWSICEVWFVRDRTLKIKTKNLPVILRLTHDLSVLEKLNFASLFLEIQDLPKVHLSYF